MVHFQKAARISADSANVPNSTDDVESNEVDEREKDFGQCDILDWHIHGTKSFV